ncbi:Ubiquinone biosynthesis protein COQ4, mitochondrial [Nymphon striatum]|nr:Ubiquinone biosynthesis protein COQ4, mitochondrial [Nymphon striatum]
MDFTNWSRVIHWLNPTQVSLLFCSEAASQEYQRCQLYPTHVPLSSFQRVLLSVGSAAMAITDPRRDGYMVATFGETTGSKTLVKMHAKMSSSTEGNKILRDRPRINSESIDLEYLKTLPINSLGKAYVQFLETNKVTPDSRLPVQFVDDPELAYVMQRYREVHDLYHTVLGMPTNMLGEVAVKWVEALQTSLPMCITAAIFGPVRFTKRQRQKYLKHYLPWAINCGMNSKFILNVYFENHWEEDIDELRESLHIPVLSLPK